MSIARDDELEMYDHLVAEAKDAGPVPDSPEEIVETHVVATAMQAQPAPKDSVSVEKLAAMRARIAQGSPSRPEPKPAREVGPLDPETAERWKISGQDRRMYVTLYGALPAELTA